MPATPLMRLAAAAAFALAAGSATAETAPPAWAEDPAMKGVTFGEEPGPPYIVQGWADNGGVFNGEDQFSASVFQKDGKAAIAVTRFVRHAPDGKAIFTIATFWSVAAPEGAFVLTDCSVRDQPETTQLFVVETEAEGRVDMWTSQGPALLVDRVTGAAQPVPAGTATCFVNEP